jgi:MFS family permease
MSQSPMSPSSGTAPESIPPELRSGPVGRLRALKIVRPLEIRDFALLWIGMSVSLFGDGIYYVAIAWQVYELENTPTALAIVGIAETLPLVLFVLIGGVVSDRFDRRKVLIASDVIRGVAIAAVGVLSILDAIELWHIVALVSVYGTGDALFGPAFGSIVPDVVPQHLLVEANAIDQFMRPFAFRLVGPALGGLIIAAVGVGWAFVIDALTFVASAVAVGLMTPKPLVERAKTTVRSALSDVAEGFRFVRAHTWLWGTLAAAAFSLLVYMGPMQVLVPFIVKNKLDGGAADLGWVYAAGGVGSVLTAFVVGQWGVPRRHMTFMYFGWALAVGGPFGFALCTETWHALIVSFVQWSGVTMGLIVWMTLLHRLVPTELLGRVSSFDWQMSIALVPVSFALTGWVSDRIGVDATLLWGGGLGVIITLAFLFLPGMRDTERDATFELQPALQES